MKLLKILLLFICLGTVFTATAQRPFTAGNIVVYRVGDGSAMLDDNAAKIFLDEYTVNGVLVQSIQMPTTAVGSDNILTAPGRFNSQGLLNLSADGKYLIVPGTNRPLGTSTPVGSVVGVVDFNGNINTSTAVTDFSESIHRPLTAISDDGNRIWLGGNGGMRYTTKGSTSSTLLSAEGVFDLKLEGGQLYANVFPSIFKVGTGLPTSGSPALSLLPGLPEFDLEPYQFAFADLDPDVAGADVLYIADQGEVIAGIVKYSLVGGVWTLNGNVGSQSERYTGLTIKVSGTTVTLFATRRGPNNSTIRGGQLIKLTDNSGYNGTITGTPEIIATVPTPNNMAFRGVARVPLGCPPVSGLRVPDISATQARIEWNTSVSGSGFEYSVTTSATPPVSGTSTTANSILETSLVNGTTYYVHVRTVCSPGGNSEWTTRSFVTGCKPPASPLLTITSNSTGNVTFNWNQVFGASSYEYFVSTSNTPPVAGIAVSNTTATRTDLNPVTTYYVHVRSSCGGGSFSEWVTKSFATSCFAPALNLTVMPKQAGVTWNKINNAVNYEYALTYTAAKPLSGNRTTDTSYLVSKLTDGRGYYFHARAACANGTVSDWNSIKFNVPGMEAYPNPVRETLTINLYGTGTNGQVVIADAMGRVVKQIQQAGANNIEVDVRSWSAGIYLVRYSNGTNSYTIRIMKK